ncbi:hypothetical protein JCM10212_001704 [Sporobolomyces blumeae]
MRREWRIYASLIIVRIVIALTSFGTIHPDEHFQNPEVAASLVFDYAGGAGAPLRTWEWQGDAPCRSVAPVWLSTGAAFRLVRAMLGPRPSARALFAAQRIAMCLLSLVVDACIWETSRSHLALVLFASSPVTLTFLVRPFSNSLETLALALSLLFARRVYVHRHRRRNLVPLGVALAWGVWTRVTFLAFAFPSVLAVVVTLAKQTNHADTLFRRALATLKSGSPAIAPFFLTASFLVLVDTRFYEPRELLRHLVADPSRWVVTPLNLLRYNLSTENLADHGIHPRYLHVVVNLPMLSGAGVFVVGQAVRSLWRDEPKDRKTAFTNRVLVASVVVPLVALSIQPHQEPRFLVPLVVPIVLLAPTTPLSSPRSQKRKQRRLFWSLWLVHSLLLTTLFGYLHQGGLVPTLFRLNRGLRLDLNLNDQSVDLVFYKTFMPPRHLLVPPSSPGELASVASITDLGGAPLDVLRDALLEIVDEEAKDDKITVGRPRTEDPSSTTYLVAPAYLFDPSSFASLANDKSTRQLCFDSVYERRTSGIHVDMDRLDEMVAAEWARVGVGCTQEKNVCA